VGVIASWVQAPKHVDVFSGICLFVCSFVCQHDNFRKSKHRMMKLGVGALYKISAKFKCGGHSLPGVHPEKCGIGLRRWENQCGLSSFYNKNEFGLKEV